jgi:hypothetical protein
VASLETFAQSLADLLDRQSLHALVQDAEDAERDARLRQVGGWLYDPVGFLNDCIDWPDGQKLADYQDEILRAIPRERRVSGRGPHGLGKTTISALAVWWFALTRDLAGIDWKIATTAGAWRQLEHYLWPEIHKWSRRIRWDRVGRRLPKEHSELLQLNLKLQRGAAFAVASNDPALIEGVHADHVLYVFDESKAIPAAVFDAAEGAFAAADAQPGLEAYAVAFSTPGEPSGRFYEIHQRKAGLEDWWVRHVTLAEAVAARRVSQAWAEQRARQWGEGSALYANRVLGEFHVADEDGVIPLAWIEAAVERWKAWRDGGGEVDALSTVGVDVARSGADQTVMAPRHGDVVTELRYTTHEDTMATAGRTEGILTAAGCGTAVVDVIGIGAGVVDKLRENGFDVNAFNASEGTHRRDRTGELGFTNCRSAAWWNLREMLDPAYGATLALPDDDLLIGDLTAPRWRVLSGGKIQVESKKDIKKRLGRSTDSGDAVVQACWTPGAPRRRRAGFRQLSPAA